MLERYGRHALIDWFSQERLKTSKFAVIGVGAVGNEVAKNLALLGVGSIHLFDLDKVEVHNLTRSVLFRESDVGQSKVSSAASRLKDLDPSVEVVGFEGDFWTNLRMSELRTYTTIFCCVDNFEARIRLNQLAALCSVNLVNTAIDSRYVCVELYPFSVSGVCACYECNLPPSAYQRISQRYSCGWLRRVAQVERKVPTTVVTSAVAGAIAVSYALHVPDTGELNAVRTLIDTKTGSSTLADLESAAECPCCSSFSGPVTLLRTGAVMKCSLLNETVNEGFGQLTVRTSDQILAAFRCTSCDDSPKIVFGRASDYDDRLTTCDRCGQQSVEVEIRDQFTVEELRKRFDGRQIPAKFLMLDLPSGTTVIELNGEQK